MSSLADMVRSVLELPLAESTAPKCPPLGSWQGAQNFLSSPLGSSFFHNGLILTGSFGSNKYLSNFILWRKNLLKDGVHPLWTLQYVVLTKT